MSDVLIRNVPDDVVSAIDSKAARMGLSRSQYLRLRLAQDASVGTASVTAADLQAFSSTFADLGDDGVMAAAWS